MVFARFLWTLCWVMLSIDVLTYWRVSLISAKISSPLGTTCKRLYPPCFNNSLFSWRQCYRFPDLSQKLLMPNTKTGYVGPPPEDVRDEAYTVLEAAADTAGNAMITAAWHIGNNPIIREKLSAELRQAFPDLNSDLVALEKLPYLVSIATATFRFLHLRQKSLVLLRRASGKFLCTPI